MKAYVFAFVIAAVTCGILTPLVRRLAFRIGAVSGPGGRNVNERTIPRLGGIAICVAFFAPLLSLYFVESSVAHVFRAETIRAAGLFVGGVSLCALGVLDDTRRVRALYKLYVQLGVAILAFSCGFRIEVVHLPIFGDLSMGIFSLPVTIAWIVGIINAINLVDGLDGLAGGVVFFAALTNFIVAYMSGSIMVALVMASMLGAVLGFLFYNFNPARIFMGDSGSYFLGYTLATTSLLGSMQGASTAVSLLVPIIALGVPIFDTLFAMVRRVLERRPIFSPDRGHVHHRLLDMGITHKRAVLILYGLSVVFTIAAIGVSIGKSWQAGIAILAASVVLVGFIRFAGYFEYLHIIRRQKARLRTRDTELLREVIPHVPSMLMAARNEDEVWGAVRAIMKRADLAVIEVLVPPDSKGEASLRFTREGGAPTDVELITARFPLGREDIARATLKFAWESDFGDVAPQTEVLLQVICDIVARELTRVGSAFAPLVLVQEPAALSVRAQEAALDRSAAQ